MSPRPRTESSGAEGVADALWMRVRRMNAELERLASGPDQPDADARIDATRLRAARAVQRAELADRLADELREITRRRSE